MKRRKNPLLRPQGSSQAKTTDNAERWYEIRASASGSPAEIIIFEQIGGWGISARQLLQEARDAGLFTASAVDIRIHSGGGSVLDGFAIFNTLGRLTGEVNIYIDGVAASMASVICMLPGATVHIPENGWLMIHNPWGGAMGDAGELRDYADLLERHGKNMIAAYVNKTGLSAEEVEALMKDETWMDGQQAVEKGFADVVTPALPMAACINENVTKEYEKMPQAAKKFFAPHGAAPITPANPANPAGSEKPENTLPAGATVDVSAIAAQAMQMMQAKEGERKTAVTAVFTNFAAFGDLKNDCLADVTCTEAVARQRLLEKMGEQTEPAGGGYVHIHAGNGNLVGDSVKNIILARAGYEERQADNRYSGMSLAELARASLVDRGVGVAGRNKIEMVGMAFTHSSSDFSYILMNVATKSALAGWDEAEETFDQWTRTGHLSDFKDAYRVGIDSFPTLREVRPGAEYKYATLSDRGAKIALATYGDLFSIDRQAIINDDMSFLTRIPMAMGTAAKATVGDLVYAVLTSNANFNGEPLFSADRNNLISGELSVENLASARAQMKRQKSDSDRTLNIKPAFLLVPTIQEALADQIINSTSVPGSDTNSGIKNPIQGMATIIGEPRLDDADEDAWYLAAAKGRDTIEVSYLDGNAAPFIESTTGFTVDGVVMKVRIDAGVAPMDYRGLLKSSGV